VRIARIFLQPDGRSWIDLPLADGQTLASLESSWRTEGVLVFESSFICPYRSMHHTILFTLDQLPVPKPENKQGPQVVSFTRPQPWAPPPETPPDQSA
jgi:hypothetical protein